MEVYTDWCNTPTAQIITKSKEMYLKSISDLHEIVMGGLVVGEEGIGTKGGEMSVQDMIKSIKEVPDIIKDHINMKTIQQKDVAEVKMKIKGETPLTRGELKVIQRASTK